MPSRSSADQVDEIPARSPLLDLFELQDLGADVYRATSRADDRMPRMYGGQVVAQALRAAM